MILRAMLLNTFFRNCTCFAPLFTIVFLSACSSQPQKTIPSAPLPSEQTAALNTTLEDLLAKDSFDFKSAEVLNKQFQEILLASPEYVTAQIGHYRLNYAMELESIDIDNKEKVVEAQRKLLRMYLKMPKAARQELLPPTMLLYQVKYPDYIIGSSILLSTRYFWATGKHPRKVTKEDLYKLILLSAKASPENHKVRAMAAEHAFESGHDRFGIAALKEMIDQSPNAVLAPSVLADYYFNSAWHSSCANNHQDALQKSLALYKKVIALAPEFALATRQQTTLAYALLGLKPLAMNEAKILAESNDFQSIMQAAYVYTHYQRFDLAETAFEKAATLYDFKAKPHNRFYADYLMASGQWIEAKKAYKKYLANRNTLNSWDTLYAALLAKKLQSLGHDVSFQNIRSASGKFKEGTYDWPEALNKILHGSKNYPKPATLCQQQQLDFYKGVSAILNDGDRNTAEDIAKNLKQEYMSFRLEQKLINELLLQ